LKTANFCIRLSLARVLSLSFNEIIDSKTCNSHKKETYLTKSVYATSLLSLPSNEAYATSANNPATTVNPIAAIPI